MRSDADVESFIEPVRVVANSSTLSDRDYVSLTQPRSEAVELWRRLRNPLRESIA
jgi:hypothetical protein